MAEQTRTPNNARSTANGFNPGGVYEAIVVSHLDTTYMGGLLVDVLKPTSSNALPERLGTTVEARYLMPFYGTTNRETTTANDGYSATQKTYGMWMVPPDIGTRVLVIFLEGGSRCYWIGCIPDMYMNFMVPDGRASTELTTDITPENLKGKKLPTGEYNKKLSPQGDDPTRYRKPYNKDFTQSLEVQGLLGDEHRGTTTTSARREVPSAVFGVNTPGPYDKREGAPRAPQGQHEYEANLYTNRLGGHSFVMDDGDDKFLRKTTADAGPPEYVNIENGETGGDPTLPHNELLRFRTRTGHQILMHNTEDFIYIANSRGTAWVELSSDGKIDVYANDSISLHSDRDINLSADRDINIEGGRNVNIRASAAFSDASPESTINLEDGESFTAESGRVQIESKFDTRIRADRDLKIHVERNRDDYVKENFKSLVDIDRDDTTLGHHYSYVQSEISITTDNSYKLHATNGTANITASQNINLQSTGADISLQANGGKIAGDGNTDIIWNSRQSVPAELPTPAVPAGVVSLLPDYSVPKVNPGGLAGQSVQSIMKRVPTHEPWIQHENLNPLAVKPNFLDREYDFDLSQVTTIPITTDTFRKNQGSVASGNTSDERPVSTTSTGAGDVQEPDANISAYASDQDITRIVETGPGYNVVELADGTTVRNEGTRAWRNNNPGNIEYGAFARRMGAIGTDGRFAIFPNYEAGRAAKERLLFNTSSYRDLTLSQAINRYAPSFENNTAAYIANVSTSAGLPPSTRMRDIPQDLRDDILTAFERQEGFRSGTTRVVGGNRVV